jgi:hypothetical protein
MVSVKTFSPAIKCGAVLFVEKVKAAFLGRPSIKTRLGIAFILTYLRKKQKGLDFRLDLNVYLIRVKNQLQSYQENSSQSSQVPTITVGFLLFAVRY